MPRAIETHCQTIGVKAPHVSIGLLKQVLALAEPRAKQEARSVLCLTCQ